MDNLIYFFELGLLYHGDLAGTLQAFYLTRDEMKSDNCDGYMEHLKKVRRYMYKKVLDL